MNQIEGRVRQMTRSNRVRFYAVLWPVAAMWWAVVGLALAGCLLPGCQVALTPADKMWGDASKSPKLSVKKNWFGVAAEAGTNFSGDVDLIYDPVGGGFKIKGKIDSNAGSVLDKYPAWIGAMDATRQAEIATLVEREKLQVEKWRAAADIVRAAGEAGASVATALLPSLIGESGNRQPSNPFDAALEIFGALPPDARTELLSRLMGMVAPPLPEPPP